MYSENKPMLNADTHKAHTQSLDSPVLDITAPSQALMVTLCSDLQAKKAAIRTDSCRGWGGWVWPGFIKMVTQLAI